MRVIKKNMLLALVIGVAGLVSPARAEPSDDEMVLKGMADGGAVSILEEDEMDGSSGTSGVVLTDDGQAVWQGGAEGASLSQFPEPSTTSKGGGLGSYLSGASSKVTGVMAAPSGEDTTLIEQISASQAEETQELEKVVKQVEQNTSNSKGLMYSD